MTPWSNQPAFVAYALACVLLCANLIFLWMFSAVQRAKSKTAMNPEDAAKFKVTLVDTDPPAVARVLRAHDNAQASIFPFLFLGLTFVLAGGGSTTATIVFALFVVARWLHTLAYLKGLQPWRTIFFLTGLVCIVVLLLAIVWLTVHGS